MIAAHYVYTQEIRKLADQFEEFHGNQNRFVLHSKEVKQPEGAVEFQSDSWYIALQNKIEYCVAVLKKHANDLLLFTDIDIFIYRPDELHDYVLERFENEKLSFLAMQEHTSDRHNGGFIFVKATAEILSLYEKTLEVLSFYINHRKRVLNKLLLFCKCGMTTLPYADQTIMDKYLKKSDIRYAYIPNKIGCWGKNPIEKTTLYHHAVCTKNQEEKISLLTQKYEEYLQITKDKS